MAIYGGGGRMGAYGDPDAENNNNPGSLFGQLLGGLGASFKDDKGLFQGNKDGSMRIGKQKGLDDSTKKAWENFEGKFYDDKGLFRANPKGPGRFIMGKREGIDALGDQEGLVQRGDDGNYRLGSQTGVDDSTKKALSDFKGSFYDDKGLFRANPDGPGKFIMGREKGVDSWQDEKGLVQRNNDGSLRLGGYKGLDLNKGKGYSGDFAGVDMLQDNKGFVQGGKLVNPLKGRYGLGSRIREMIGSDFEGPVQPKDNSLTGAVGRTEADITDAPNQNVVVNQETGENYGNAEVLGPLLASKVTNPSQVPARHAGMMQKFLNTQGFQLEEDGKWGPKSTKAMAEWMQQSGTGNQANVNNRLNPITNASGRPGLYQ